MTCTRHRASVRTSCVPTRRRFFQQAAGAAATLGCWSGASGRAAPAPNDRLNIGFIGVGNRGLTNLAELHSEHVAALCDVDSRYLDEVSRRHPGAKRYVDFRELLEQADLDAVVVSTPDHTHFPAAMLAMRRGLHVYCEKPLAHSISEVRQMAATARAQGVVTQTGNQHHATEGYRRTAEIIQSGVLGPIREVHAWTNRPIWPQGIARPADRPAVPGYLNWDLWLGPAPERPYHGVYHPGGWRGWFDFGSGALGDMGPHLLDPVLWALDLAAPTIVAAEASGLQSESFPLASTVRFDFPERAGQPAVTLTWYDGDRQPPASVTGIERLPDNGVLFLGERAKLFAPSYGGRPTVLPRTRNERIELPEPFLSSSPGHHLEWVRACKGQGEASCDFDYGARLTEICLVGKLAVRASAWRPGEELTWDRDLTQFSNAPELSRRIDRDYRTGWERPDS